MKSKKLFLSSLLLLGLLVTACNNQNQPSEESSEETPSSQVAPSSGAQSSSAQTTSEEDIGIPAPAAGSFAFSDTELATEQEIHTRDQKNYLNYSKEYYRITSSDLNSFNAKGTSNNSAPLPVKIHWNYTPQAGKTVSKYSFVFGQKADLSDGYEVAGTASKNISFYNAFLGTNYFKVIANFADGSKQESDIKTFKVAGQAPRNLKVGNMPNCRDMGGRTTTAGGKIKQGLIYRTSGSKFDNSTPSNDEAKEVLLKQLKVKTEINVANSTTNNVNLTGVAVKNCYMDYGATPYSNLARNAEKIRNVIDILADENNYPVFYHCRIGTDRTGITGMMIGGLLGIPFNEIFQDYCFSNFAPIDGQRYANKSSDPNGDDPAKYVDELLKMPGANFQEQVYNALLSIGVPSAKLDAIINFLTEGTKATIPNTAKVGTGDALVSTGSKKTSTDYAHPAVYYATTTDQSVSFTSTLTAGKKDLIIYLGSTDSSKTSKLSDKLTLKIDNEEKSLGDFDKTLFLAGFGKTQQNSRTGYMINILGNFEFTAGEHVIEIAVKSGTFNIGTIALFDNASRA